MLRVVKMTVNTSQQCPCVHSWFNRQLTDFDPYSYLPQMVLWGNSLNEVIINYIHVCIQKICGCIKWSGTLVPSITWIILWSQFPVTPVVQCPASVQSQFPPPWLKFHDMAMRTVIQPTSRRSIYIPTTSIRLVGPLSVYCLEILRNNLACYSILWGAFILWI